MESFHQPVSPEIHICNIKGTPVQHQPDVMDYVNLVIIHIEHFFVKNVVVQKNLVFFRLSFVLRCRFEIDYNSLCSDTDDLFPGDKERLIAERPADYKVSHYRELLVVANGDIKEIPDFLVIIKDFSADNVTQKVDC